MTDIIFSFDTEDFTSRTAADAIFREAEILRKNGVRGCFCLVGLLAKQLTAWGRTDVLEALRHHEINSHSYGHTLHPIINEYTDIADFDEARREVIRQESEALRLIREATGTEKVFAAVPPGNQKSYAAMYAYADMGIPIYADTFCDPEDGGGAWYCNIFHVSYTHCMEETLFDGGEPELRALLDRLAQRKRAVLYTHPNASMFEEWWDIVNYDKANLCAFGDWKPCKRRPQALTDNFFRNLDRLVRMVQADERFRIVTYGELAARLAAEKPRVLTPAELPVIREALNRTFFPVCENGSYSLSDLFLGCRDFLRGETTHVCGKVYGFLKQPSGVTEPVHVTAQQMRDSAAELPDSGFLPTEIPVGDKKIGPADWLLAALEILCGAAETTVCPKPQQPSLDVLPLVRDCAFRGTWRHADSFRDDYLSDRLRLQAWTMRFPAEA